MYTIRSIKTVESLEEAYELNQKKTNTILGGCMWLRMGNTHIATAIDLSDLGLDKIEETEESFVIGCMASLRSIECHKGLNTYFDGYLRESLRYIVGTQFRNTATIGGSIYQRFGFSDILTALLALDTQVELYPSGMMPLDEFVGKDYDNEILVKLHILKDGRKAVYESVRNTKTDFPVLAVGASLKDGEYKMAVGARPMRAMSVMAARTLPEHPTDGQMDDFVEKMKAEVTFSGNMRASKEYRQILAGVLAKRCIEKLSKGEA